MSSPSLRVESANSAARRSIPPQLLEELRQQLRRLEPVIARLVALYDQLAHHFRADPWDTGATVLDESFSQTQGLPSEIDVRAAAIRLYGHNPVPNWLCHTRRTPPALRDVAPAERSADFLPHSNSDAKPDGAPVDPQLLSDLWVQYRQTMESYRELLHACAALELGIARTLKVAHWPDFNELLRHQAGITFDDVNAAAARLRVLESPHEGQADH